MASLIEEPTGGVQPNLAPLKSYEKATKGAKLDKVKLDEYLKGRYAEFSKDREDVWREIYAAAHLIALFCRGKQQLQRARYAGGWRPYGDLKDTGTDDIRTINLTRFYIDNIVVKWVQSAANLIVRAARDTDAAILAARGGDIVIEHYENEIYTSTFRQREARLAVLTGNLIRRYYYVNDQKSTARRPIIEQIPFGGGATGYCADCGTAASPQTMMTGQCEACGSPNISMDQMAPIQVDTIRGQEEYKSGSIACDNIPIWNVRFDLSGRLEESDYLLYQRRMRRDTLMGQLRGQMKVPSGKNQDAGLDAITALAHSGPSIGGRNNSTLVNKADEQETQYVDLVEMWLEPRMYGHIELKEDCETISGQTIPAGPLVDQFPDGLCVMGLDNLQTPLYLFNEAKCDHWIAEQYHMDVISGSGDGMVDIIEIQRQFNIGNSQIFQQIRSQATPAVLYDKDLITGDKAAYLANPKMNVPVDLTRLPEQRSLQQAVYQLMPGQLPGHVIEYVHQFLNNMFQLTAHATDFSGGLPGVNNSTATGAQIGSALAQSLHAPQLQGLAEMNRRGAMLVLKLFKKYCKDEHYLKLAGKNDSEMGVWLKGAQIDTDVTVEIVAESWLPQSGFEKRERLKEFIQFFGNVEGLQAALTANPKLVGNLIRLSDIDIDVADWDASIRLCRRRIEQMKKALPIAEAAATSMDPTILQSMKDMGADPAVLFANMLLNALEPKPDIREDGLDTMAAYYRDWLVTDEGLQASPMLREAVKAIADTTLRFMMQGGAQAAAQMPPQMPPMMPGGAPPGGGGFPEMAPPGQGQPEAAANANLSSPQVGAMSG